MDEYERKQFMDDVVHQLNEHHESTHVLDLANAKLLPGTKLRIVSDDAHWLEVELLNNSGDVYLTSGEMLAVSRATIQANKKHESAPVEGRIIGSLKNVGSLPSHFDDMPVLEGTVLNPLIPAGPDDVLPLQVKHWHVLVYQVGNEHRVLNGVERVIITLTSGSSFDLWE